MHQEEINFVYIKKTWKQILGPTDFMDLNYWICMIIWDKGQP